MWEYKTEQFKIGRGQNSLVDEKLNEFGKDGWEAFSIEYETIYGPSISMVKWRRIFGYKYEVKLKRRVE